MGNNDLLSNLHIVAAFYPVADAFSGGITTDAVSLASYKRATLVVMTGAIEDAGISNLVTVEACTSAAGGNNTAMPFRYRACRSSTTVDTWSALTAAASTGYNFALNNAVLDTMWYLEVTAAEVAAAYAGAYFVRAVIAETANKTITAGGLWILSEPRFPNSIPVQAIA
jgi:hypothetical protein